MVWAGLRRPAVHPAAPRRGQPARACGLLLVAPLLRRGVPCFPHLAGPSRRRKVSGAFARAKLLPPPPFRASFLHPAASATPPSAGRCSGAGGCRVPLDCVLPPAKAAGAFSAPCHARRRLGQPSGKTAQPSHRAPPAGCSLAPPRVAAPPWRLLSIQHTCHPSSCPGTAPSDVALLRSRRRIVRRDPPLNSSTPPPHPKPALCCRRCVRRTPGCPPRFPGPAHCCRPPVST